MNNEQRPPQHDSNKVNVNKIPNNGFVQNSNGYIPAPNFMNGYPMQQPYPNVIPQYHYHPVDVVCHRCLELQHDMNHFKSQMTMLNKNIELLNEQVKLLDMKLSISTSLQNNNNNNKNNNCNNCHNQPTNNNKPRNNNNNNNQNRNKNNNKKTDQQKQKQSEFVDPLSFNFQSKDFNSEPTFVIQFDDFGPPPPSGSDTNSAKGPDMNNPLGILGSLFSIINGGLGKKKPEVTNTNIESSEEFEVSEHDSDEEFEELEVTINNIDDLIELGKKYEETLVKLKKEEDEKKKVEEEKKKEETTETTKEALKKQRDTFVKHKNHKKVDQKGFNFDKILLRDGTVKSLNPKAQTFLPKLEIGEDWMPKLEEKKEEPKDISHDCVIDGKKYSINLRVLYNLIKPLTKLKSMIGLDDVKNAIVDMILYYLQNFEKKNNNMLHTVIEGPPGVGKTQLGKILAEVYAGLGVIPSSKFKLVKRSDLVGEYLGHTAPKTQKIIDEADGGVLFIDEAYSLGNEEKKDSFSKECIDTINQNLSENKRKFICIIAGYPDELDRCFFSYNPGLKRRFPFKFSITGYTPEELKNIFIKRVHDIKWKMNDDYDDKDLTTFFKNNMENFPYFGGDIDNFLLACKFAHSRRVFGKHPKNKRHFSKTDIEIGFTRFVQNKKKEESSKAYQNMYS